MAAPLLDAAPVTRPLVWLAAPEGHPTDVSRPYRDYFGITERERAQWNWFWAVHPCDLRRVLHAWQSAVRSRTAFRAQFRLRRADGVYRWHRGTARPEKDRAGHTLGWVGAFTDIHDDRPLAGESRCWPACGYDLADQLRKHV